MGNNEEKKRKAKDFCENDKIKREWGNRTDVVRGERATHKRLAAELKEAYERATSRRGTARRVRLLY